MKRQIRWSVFETNSSSVHSLAFNPSGREKCKINRNKDGYLIVDYGQFDRNYDLFTTQTEKLSYLMTQLYYIYGSTEKVYEGYLFEIIEDAVCKYANAKGIKIKDKTDPYIDHQSIPEYGEISLINIYDDDAIIDFVFNKNVYLKTKGD